jgi:hypothetical protein
MSARALAVTRAWQHGQLARNSAMRVVTGRIRGMSNVVVLFREALPGLAEHRAARAALGVDAAGRIGVLGELACHAGPALARRLARRGLGVRFLPARGRQRGVVRRFRRLTELGFQLGDAGVQRFQKRKQLVDALVLGGVLCQQPVDPRHQRCQEMGISGTRRIGPSLRHGERESARRSGHNTSDPVTTPQKGE